VADGERMCERETEGRREEDAEGEARTTRPTAPTRGVEGELVGPEDVAADAAEPGRAPDAVLGRFFTAAGEPTPAAAACDASDAAAAASPADASPADPVV
jgi:hypothetical protein